VIHAPKIGTEFGTVKGISIVVSERYRRPELKRLSALQRLVLAELVKITKTRNGFPTRAEVERALDKQLWRQLKVLEKAGFVEQVHLRGPWRAIKSEEGLDLVWEFRREWSYLEEAGACGVRYHPADCRCGGPPGAPPP